MHRPFARALRGTKIYGEISGRRFMRESFIAGKCGKEILAPFCYQGTCNTALFNMWIEDFLVPALKHGQIIVLDNAAFHKSQKTKELIENAGCTLLFLPPYSPDLNPIETFWANFKAKVRSLVTSFSTLQSAIDYVFKMSDFQVN